MRFNKWNLKIPGFQAFFFAKTKHCANCVREFGQQSFWGRRQRSGRGSVCLHVMIVRFSNSLFLSQHWLFFAFYFRGSLIGTTNLVSLSNSNQESFFSRVDFENKFGIFSCPEQHRFLLSLCVCLLLAPMLILPIVWYLFFFAFLKKKIVSKKEVKRMKTT